MKQLSAEQTCLISGGDIVYVYGQPIDVSEYGVDSDLANYLATAVNVSESPWSTYYIEQSINVCIEQGLDYKQQVSAFMLALCDVF